MRRLAYLLTASLIAITLSLQGCVTVLDVTTSTPIKQSPSERSLGNFIDDNTIETIAAVNIRKASQALRDANVSVTSFNGVVLLTGQVSSNELRQQAAQIVNEVQQVRKVHNELEVKGVTSVPARMNDSWLTSKVRTGLLLDEHIASGNVKIVTENGVVFLLGVVTRKQAEQAVDVARKTRGVQRIVNVFEYID